MLEASRPGRFRELPVDLGEREGLKVSRKTRALCCPRCRGRFFTDRQDKTYCSEPCRKSAENSRRWLRRKERSQP